MPSGIKDNALFAKQSPPAMAFTHLVKKVVQRGRCAGVVCHLDLGDVEVPVDGDPNMQDSALDNAMPVWINRLCKFQNTHNSNRACACVCVCL